jgi:hypothetical protein
MANVKLSGATIEASGAVTGSGFRICFLSYLYSIFRAFQINPIIPVQEDEGPAPADTEDSWACL